MRTLLVIPVIRTERDIASLQGEQLTSTDAVWSGIRRIIEILKLPYKSVQLYQEGLPVCEKERDIVKEIAAEGSRNHQLILDLMELGARLTGTEDPHLLLQEYRLLNASSDGAKNGNNEIWENESRKLLQGRDGYIAERINSTLSAGEIGLLFVSPAHSVEEFLDADILVQRILPSLRDEDEKAELIAGRGHARPSYTSLR